MDKRLKSPAPHAGYTRVRIPLPTPVMGASSNGSGQNATNVQIEVRVLMRPPRPVVQSERIQSSEGWDRRSNRRGPASYMESGQVGYASGCLPERSGFDSRTLRHEAKLDRRTEAGLSSPYRWVRLPLALPVLFVGPK